MARRALRQLFEKRLTEEMAEYSGVAHSEDWIDRDEYQHGWYLKSGALNCPAAGM
jgi:hypothetical protein